MWVVLAIEIVLLIVLSLTMVQLTRYFTHFRHLKELSYKQVDPKHDNDDLYNGAIIAMAQAYSDQFPEFSFEAAKFKFQTIMNNINTPQAHVIIDSCFVFNIITVFFLVIKIYYTFMRILSRHENKKRSLDTGHVVNVAYSGVLGMFILFLTVGIVSGVVATGLEKLHREDIVKALKEQGLEVFTDDLENIFPRKGGDFVLRLDVWIYGFALLLSFLNIYAFDKVLDVFLSDILRPVIGEEKSQDAGDDAAACYESLARCSSAITGKSYEDDGGSRGRHSRNKTMAHRKQPKNITM